MRKTILTNCVKIINISQNFSNFCVNNKKSDVVYSLHVRCKYSLSFANGKGYTYLLGPTMSKAGFLKVLLSIPFFVGHSSLEPLTCSFGAHFLYQFQQMKLQIIPWNSYFRPIRHKIIILRLPYGFLFEKKKWLLWNVLNITKFWTLKLLRTLTSASSLKTALWAIFTINFHKLRFITLQNIHYIALHVSIKNQEIHKKWCKIKCVSRL